MELILGTIMLAGAGAMLHDVPFPRFICAYILITLGSKLFAIGFGAV
jgi:hypothetical protein